ncbi:MAG: glycosyltransferase [Planctomycetes bacterium GWF2_41_51]|nr:MAG: glycosyltransferase [Planctomycetes bacterium GWF2_41_51]HBG27070.1 glycosyltransferase [Phycisphaerales bacterium]
MRIAMFYHSLISDWNNGNAHFLRGIVAELLRLGHNVNVYEPENGWSYNNLIKFHGNNPIEDFSKSFPHLKSIKYRLADFDLNVLNDMDLVIVHEWNEPQLIRMITQHRKSNTGYKLLFHDTHHRCACQPQHTQNLDISSFDGVLAFGKVLADIYLAKNWNNNVWVWHEAADTNIFKQVNDETRKSDLVWIGNWGDNERSQEIQEFLIAPSCDLKLKANVYGVRYPSKAMKMLSNAGIQYKGWLANHKVPHIFQHHRFTVHIPRRPYSQLLVGVPTIRVFEALACGIPLICAPWQDSENLFTPGKDYLMAENGSEMKKQMKKIINEPEFAAQLAEHGRKTISQRHTCAHRVTQLLSICKQLDIDINTEKKQSAKKEKINA